jgi:hypothetical protein
MWFYTGTGSNQEAVLSPTHRCQHEYLDHRLQNTAADTWTPLGEPFTSAAVFQTAGAPIRTGFFQQRRRPFNTTRTHITKTISWWTAPRALSSHHRRRFDQGQQDSFWLKDYDGDGYDMLSM